MTERAAHETSPIECPRCALEGAAMSARAWRRHQRWHERFDALHGHEPRAGRRRLRRFVGARLHRKLFASFALAIVLAGAAAALTVRFVGDGGASWAAQKSRASRFVQGRFAAVWHEPAARDELGRALARDLELGVQVYDARGALLQREAFPARCRWRFGVAVSARDGASLGRVELCGDAHRAVGGWWRTLSVLGAVLLVLYAVAGKVARRLAHPLSELTRVARELGEGKLASRARLCGYERDEVGALAEALHEMAERIDAQLRDQRALLAAVSHELRTPLARVRLLVEYARDGLTVGPGARPPLDEIEAELVEMDVLVGELLAAARIEFSSLSLRELDAGQVARRAAERAGLGAERVSVRDDAGALRADPTLLARALAALLDNAKKHGQGVRALRVHGDGDRVVFAVEDLGAGFADGEEDRVFDAFVQGSSGDREASGLGLGLSLVRRIAEAHGGEARAENALDEAGRGCGGRVLLELPRAPAAPGA